MSSLYIVSYVYIVYLNYFPKHFTHILNEIKDEIPIRFEYYNFIKLLDFINMFKFKVTCKLCN